MEHQSRPDNGVHSLQNNPQLGNSTGAPVFPGYGQNYASFYSLPDEPVNLSSSSTEVSPYALPIGGVNLHLPQPSMNSVSTSANLTRPLDKPIPAMPELTMHQPRDTMKHGGFNMAKSKTSPSKLPLPALRRTQTINFKPKPQSTYPPILPFPPAANQSSVNINNNNNNRALNSHMGQTHAASASPAIQAALNQPVVGRDRPMKHPEVGTKLSPVSSHPKLQQAPTMKHFLSQPPLQHKPLAARPSAKPHKPTRRRSHKQDKSTPASQLQGVVPAKRGKTSQERYIAASQISGLPLSSNFLLQPKSSHRSDQFAPVSSPRATMMHLYSGSGENSLITSEASNDGGPTTFGLDAERFTPVDLRRHNEGQEFILVPPKIEFPEAPRSVLEMRLYKKQKNLLLLLPKSLRNNSHSVDTGNADSHAPRQLHVQQHSRTLPELGEDKHQLSAHSKLSVLAMSSSPSTKKFPSGSQAFHSTTDFDWTLYLKVTRSKAAPHSAFKHVEGSLLNGFMVGMKVETPLRDVDTDKYWLATIVGVFGPMLKLRFDGYGDKSKDFTMLCSSGQLHPIGWCARNQKSLLPPADIRHTQKQWKNFLMNALQGAKTVPMYLLSPRASPWIADRIRQGMRLEVQHEHLPTAVWIAKVIRNFGGRMKLRYEGSIDDATDFWLFYFDSRIHPCGWAAEAHHKYNIIYKPPDEIRAAYSYEGWSKILLDVTSDSSLERIPADIFQMYMEPSPHTCRAGQLLEIVYPEGTHISPARVSALIDNSNYFVVEIIDEPSVVTKTCHIRDLTLLPLGWCDQHQVKLGRPNANFSWLAYAAMSQSRAVTDPNIVKQRVPIHQFVVGQRLEATNLANKEQICVANIARITGRLMWLEICTSHTAFTTIIVDVLSQAIFPAGWCESNKYPLVSPIVQVPKLMETSTSSSGEANVHGELGPKIYFNHTCFSGPFLSKGRIQQLPEFLGPGYIRLIVKEMLNLLISVGYKSSYILKTLERTGNPNPNFHPQIIKTKCKGKSYEAVIEVCTKRSELIAFCREICKRIKCCPNLVSTEKVKDQCSENCHTMTKTQFLYMASRKPGRPSSTNPDGSVNRKKKRKRRKKVFTPKRNLYIPKYDYTGAASDNGSNSWNSDDDECGANAISDQSPGNSGSGRLDIPVTPAKSSSSTGAANAQSAERILSKSSETEGGADNPLFQLQLTSVKKLLTPMEIAAASHQYQIVKRKRGRPTKQMSPEARKRSNSLTMCASKTSHPTVPPLKIRRLESSPTPQSYEQTSLPTATQTLLPTATVVQTSLPTAADVTHPLVCHPPQINGTTSHTDPPISLLPTLLNGDIPERRIVPAIKTQSRSAGKMQIRPGDRARTASGGGSQLLMRAFVPHSPRQSALAFTRPRRYIEERDKVVLTDNPLYWDVDRLLAFIKETDCANLVASLSEQEVDGAAFMMFVLPTVQEVLELKLGPALKLCHHVERLKLAFFETFHPEEGTRQI